MRFCFGLGPVFAFEWLVASRRWQMYASRSLVVLAMGMCLVWVWWSEVWRYPEGPGELTTTNLAQVGEAFFYTMIGILLSILLLAAPAAAAGAFCNDRTSGGLIAMLGTDLSSAEIVLGKLAARFLPILSFLLLSMPVLFGALLLGGISSEALVGALLILIAVAIFGFTLALTLSIWCKHVHEVLFAVYLFWLVACLAGPCVWALADYMQTPLPDWLDYLSPYLMAYLAYRFPDRPVLREQIWFALAGLTMSVVLIIVSIVRVRTVALREAIQVRRTRSRLISRAGKIARFPWILLRMEWNPVLWRDLHRRSSSKWIWLIWLAYGLLMIGVALVALKAEDWTWPAYGTGCLVLISLLLPCILAVSGLTEDRSQGNLNVLMTTALPTWKIVLGKWLGVYRSVWGVAIPPTAIVCILSLTATRELASTDDVALIALLMFGTILAIGASVTSLGLLIATFVSRSGPALLLSIALYLLCALGIMLPAYLDARWIENPDALALGSSFFASGRLIIWAGGWHILGDELAIVVWIGIHLTTAALLFVMTLLIFDRCIGRATKQKPDKDPQVARLPPRYLVYNPPGPISNK